jgi:hypothetical protein
VLMTERESIRVHHSHHAVALKASTSAVVGALEAQAAAAVNGFSLYLSMHASHNIYRVLTKL